MLRVALWCAGVCVHDHAIFYFSLGAGVSVCVCVCVRAWVVVELLSPPKSLFFR